MIDWQNALEQCDNIRDLIDEEVPDWAWGKSPEFFESISDKIASISEWIEKNKCITPKQQKSLDNMEQGIRRWIKD